VVIRIQRDKCPPASAGGFRQSAQQGHQSPYTSLNWSSSIPRIRGGPGRLSWPLRAFCAPCWPAAGPPSGRCCADPGSGSSRRRAGRRSRRPRRCHARRGYA